MLPKLSAARRSMRSLPHWLAGGAVLSALASPLEAQRAEGALFESNRRAVNLVRRAAEVHGGLAAIRGLTAIEYQWSGVTFDRDQGVVASAAYTPRPASRPVSVRAAVDFTRNRWLTQFEIEAPGEGRATNRSVINGREVLRFDPTGRLGGRGFSRDSLPAGAPASFPFTGNLMPPVLLRQAMLRGTTLRHIGEQTAGEGVQDLVSVSNPDGSMLTLVIDRGSGRVAGLQTLGDHPLLGDMVHSWSFSDYRQVQGIAVPHAMEHRTNEWIQEEMRLVKAAVNPELPDSLFAAPAGYAQRTPSPGGPMAVRVAEGVYLAERAGGYRSMFVDTDEGVLVVEAPLNPRVTEQVAALIERTLPGRPIRFVVLTHHHYDHVGGLAAYVSRGATILIPPGTEEYIRRLLAAPRTLGTWTPAAPPRAPVLEPVHERRTIGTGDRAVEVVNIGATAHAASMLVANVPSARLLYQGDLLRAHEDGEVIRGTTGSADLWNALRKHQLSPETIAGAHGRVATIAELRAAAGAP